MTVLALRRAAAHPGRLAGRSLTAAPLVWVAASLSLSAAWVHLDGAGTHYREWWAHGVFFYVCAALQALLAALLVTRPRTAWIPLTGIAGTLGVLGMYVYSRTNGSPIGPHAGVPEDVGLLDMMTAGVELATILALVGLLDGRARAWGIRIILAAGAALWIGRATGVVL